MEVIKLHICLGIFLSLIGCSNSHEFEKSEIKIFGIIKDAVSQRNSKIFLDSRDLLSRKQIDAFKYPILFVELQTGQNGTLTQYPGDNVNQTWLAADGATLTFDHGIIKASRGMGDDVMGSTSSMPPWENINGNAIYVRNLSYLSGDNKIYTKKFGCEIRKNSSDEKINIWGVTVSLRKYEETCTFNEEIINNHYYLDDNLIVRKSYQYLSETVGYIITERLDRQSS